MATITGKLPSSITFPRAGDTLHRLVLIVAAWCAALIVPARAGWIDWERLDRTFGEPWRELLNPDIGPKMIRILAGEGVGYLGVSLLMLLVTRPWVERAFGAATLVLVHRLLAFAWLPVFAAVFLLLHLNPLLLRTGFSLQGQPITFSLPTLVGVIVFGLATATRAPRPNREYLPTTLHRVAQAMPFVVGASVCFALDRLVAQHPRSWGNHAIHMIVAQIGIIGVQVAFLLLVGETVAADWDDVRTIWPHSRPWASVALLRAAVRFVVFMTPVIAGLWLTLGYALPSASEILDRQGNLLQVFHPAGVLRIAANKDEISPAMYRAMESIEDPGLLSSPASHAPVNPVRMASIFTALTQGTQGDGSLSGGSGLAAQDCKNWSGRPLTTLASDASIHVERVPKLPRLTIVAGTLAEKVLFEFGCGWTLEEANFWFHRGDNSTLTFYLNQTYFGQGAYGIQAAALTYFGKSAGDLTVGEAAMLAGLPQAPSAYDPWRHPSLVRDRRGQVLRAMVRQGYLSPLEAATIDASPLGVAPAPVHPPVRAEAFVQRVVGELDDMEYRALSTSGLRITTTLDLSAQGALTEDVSAAVQRQKAGGVNDGGAIRIDPRTGEILAWFGGTRPVSGPDAMLDMVRAFPHQPGSTIKPFVYSCALEKGVLKPDEWLDDNQRAIGGRAVANWDLTSHGWQPAAAELTGSRNTASAELVRRMTPEGFAACLRDTFKITAPLHPEQHGVELGLGLAEVPMDELAAAYTILANNGVYIEPTALLHIRDRDGNDLNLRARPPGKQVLSCATVAWVTHALFGVSAALGITDGIASKTGSTESSSYVAGYAPDVAFAAWIGRAEPLKGLLAADVSGQGAAAIWQAQSRRLPVAKRDERWADDRCGRSGR